MSSTASIRLRKAGGSLIATIPKEVVEVEGLRAGQVVTVTFQARREAFQALHGLAPEVGPWDRSWTRGRDRF